jgi:ATP/maltotriose-dependent transcriptional regulator MalT
VAAAERARVLAREAADPYWEANATGLHCLILYWGPLPLDAVERRSREALAEAERSGVSSLAVTAHRVLARIAAQRNELEQARGHLASADAIKEGQSESLIQGTDCISRALIELVAGDLPAAERHLRKGYRQLEEMGGNGPRANVAAMLARVRLLRNQLDDAEELSRICERLAAPDQADAQVKWRSIRAIAMARRGEPSEAERLSREAVYLAGQTDQLESWADARVDLAEVLLLGGRGREASRELDQAITLYQEKGTEVGERRARRLLARARS